jgi:aminopeptidase
MTDPRITKVAEILVNYSSKVEKGDRVAILSDFAGLPLVSEIYRLCIRKGAREVMLHFDSYELDEIYAKNSTAKQRKAFPALAMAEIKRIDCWFGIISTTNTRGLSGISPKIFSEIQKAFRPVSNWRVEKTKWVLAQFPTHANAQEADMSLSDYEDFVFSAVTEIDWKKKYRQQEKLRKLLDKTEAVRIVGEGTDLTLSIKGRKAENAAGEFNMPDGEVFTSVVEDSTEGFITFSFPAIYLGREFHEVRLEFKKGKVVAATASKGEADLNKILDMDRGARRIGELGIGNNFKIQRFTKNILFDEKIGGTIHIALGKGYKETLSKNKSSLHWDMIKDLRGSGELYFDGKLVQGKGVWKI